MAFRPILSEFLTQWKEALASWTTPLQKKVVNFARKLRIVLEIIRPRFEELHAKLSLFMQVVEDVDRVNCIGWVLEDFRGGLCTYSSAR